MKIGISSDNEDIEFSPTFEIQPREAVLYEVNLPAQVERGLELISEHMPLAKGTTPIAIQTEQAHHGDYGLVFRAGEIDSVKLIPGGDVCTEFTRSVVVARISMGLDKTTELVRGREVVLRDPSKLNRLHLNVYAARNFIPHEGEERRNNNSFDYASETAHFSLRWVDGQFDNSWNDAATWHAERDSESMDRPQFDSMRTAHFVSNRSSEHVNGHFYYDLSGDIPSDVRRQIREGKIFVGLRDVEAVIGSRKTRLLPKDIPLGEFMRQFPEGTTEDNARKAAGYEFRKRESFPHIGYAPLLGILSQFGEVSARDADEIPKMDMDHGVEYTFRKILPAVKMFARA